MNFTGAYTITAEAAQSTLITAIQITAGSGRPFYLARWAVSQRTSTSSAMAGINLLRKSAAATVTSITPAATGPNFPSAAATAGHSASAEGTDSTVLERRAFNILSGIEVIYTPEEMPIVAGSGIIALKWAAAPTSATYTFLMTIIEI
jgi:hypothetical protein